MCILRLWGWDVNNEWWKSVDDDFISAFNTTSLYVPSSLYEEYRSTSPWNKFVNIKIIDDENTGISKSELEQPCNSTIYDVNGRKVVESTLKPGLYIRNGQKVVVKWLIKRIQHLKTLGALSYWGCSFCWFHIPYVSNIDIISFGNEDLPET